MKKENCGKHEALIKATAMTGISKTTKLKEEYSRQAVLLKYYQSTLQSITQSHHARANAEKRSLDHNKLNIGFAGIGIGDMWKKELKESAIELLSFKGEQYF